MNMNSNWTPYLKQEGSTATGHLLTFKNHHSPELDNHRDITVCLPPSYETHPDRRYPVLYMHDGQNLFDDLSSYSGEWQVDESLERLAQEGLEIIVVGIPNLAGQRDNEYNFHKHSVRGGGKAPLYIQYLANTLKPLIDQDFRTLSDRDHTGLMGSSMGGLISLYGFFSRPDVFALAGVLSPAFWLTEGEYVPWLSNVIHHPGRIYMDVGDQETAEIPWIQEAYVKDAYYTEKRLRELGYREELQFQLFQGAIHHESEWAKRFPLAVKHLYKQ